MTSIPAPSTRRKKNWPPRYTEVFMWRQQQVLRMREDPAFMLAARLYYRKHPVEFINHWCTTYDPRKAGRNKLSRMPMVLFPRQEELVLFLVALIDGEEDGLIEKCRDMGATWVCCAFTVWLWLFRAGSSVGWGSRKQDLVDRIGVPDSIFEKFRMIIRSLPGELLPAGFDPDKHMPFMRLVNPETGSTVTGEAGDNIGRGGRNLIYFKDESAHYERPELVEAALGDNTNVQVDISSVNGLGNVFHRRRESGVEWVDGPAIEGKTNVFVMDWRDHPEKDDAWYARRQEKARDDGLMHIFAQEIDRNYAASVIGTIIPAEWVTEAIGADKKLKFDDTGMWTSALDVADNDGKGDKNAQASRKGVCLKRLDSWSARDTGITTRRALTNVEGMPNVELQYDCIGVGAGVKSEANRLADDDTLPRGVAMIPWNAGAGVVKGHEHYDPEDKQTPLNEDFFGNLKAQGWWALRRRFEKTYRAIKEGIYFPADELISIDPDLPQLRTLQKELSQPTMGKDGRMRLIVNKQPQGTRSPNLADAVMMCYFPIEDDTPATAMLIRRNR